MLALNVVQYRCINIKLEDKMKRTYWTSEKSLEYAMNKIKSMKNFKRLVSTTKKNGGYNSITTNQFK